VAAIDDVLVQLRKFGVLLMQDARMPSVASIVAREVVRGSWWGHARSHEIFSALEALDDRDDVTFVKLIDGKVTLVDKTYFADIGTIGAARDAWQIDKLSAASRKLLARVDADPKQCVVATPAEAKIAKDLEARWLVHTHQVHTDSGAHALELRTWKRFLDDNNTRFRKGAKAIDGARKVLHACVAYIAGDHGVARVALPWGTLDVESGVLTSSSRSQPTKRSTRSK